MKVTYEMLQQAAREVDAALMANLPAPEDCWHVFSEAFEKKMAELLQQAEPSDEKLLEEILTPAKLTPSPGGKECLGNGEHPGYECQCPDCDHFLACFPEYA